MICSQCQTPAKADARFCAHCGAALPKHELASMGAARTHAELQTPKMPDKRIGPYRVVRVLRPDDNLYIVESDIKLSGDPPKTCIAIEARGSLSKQVIDQAGKSAQLKNIAQLWNQVRDERGVPFVIVSYAPGDPLDLVPVPLLPNRALNIGLQLTTIVDYLHQHDLTFNLESPQRDQSDSLKRFQKAFLLDEHDQLCFFDLSVLMRLPRNERKKQARMREDVLLILRTFIRIFTGNSLGQIIGFLTHESQQLGNVTRKLVENPPTNARNLAGAFTQMMPPQLSPSQTVPLAKPQPKPGVTMVLPPSPQLVPFAQSDVGKQREHNEDNFLSLPMDAASGLFVVADGMGGHAAGEVASQLAIEEMKQGALTEWKQLTQTPTSDNIRTRLNSWIQRANGKVIAKGRELGNNMGCTLTAALIVNQQIYAANAGDSRTYLYRGGELYPLTWDHSLVASLVRAGLLEPDGVYDHPQRNEIFRSLGQQAEVKADVFEPVELASGDSVLLCSDGLWEMVRAPQMKEILARYTDTGACCAELVRAANEKGGDDNITVVLIRVL